MLSSPFRANAPPPPPSSPVCPTSVESRLGFFTPLVTSLYPPIRFPFFTFVSPSPSRITTPPFPSFLFGPRLVSVLHFTSNTIVKFSLYRFRAVFLATVSSPNIRQVRPQSPLFFLRDVFDVFYSFKMFGDRPISTPTRNFLSFNPFSQVTPFSCVIKGWSPPYYISFRMVFIARAFFPRLCFDPPQSFISNTRKLT